VRFNVKSQAGCIKQTSHQSLSAFIFGGISSAAPVTGLFGSSALENRRFDRQVSKAGSVENFLRG